MSGSTGDRSETLLARWSRRKQADPERRQSEDRRIEEDLIAAGVVAPPAPVAEDSRPEKAPADLPSIESLTPASDFSRFMKPDVPVAARNAAVKKLFTDPHFNVMDGLDIYIDDYTKADPIPDAMLRDLAQSRMLRLFDHEEEKPAPSTGPTDMPEPVPVADLRPPDDAKVVDGETRSSAAIEVNDEIPAVTDGRTLPSPVGHDADR